MSSMTPVTFPDNAAEALKDSALRGALRTVATTFADKRKQAVDAFPGWESVRERAHDIKIHTLQRLDRYLELFAERAEAAGATVHWARDAAAARAVVRGLVAPGNTVVKSKSMTTEEIALNEALVAEGVTVVETDLGEWIIQLAGEPPSHIIAPAIHKTKQQVAQLFSERLGTPLTDDIDELTRVARRTLRARFRKADVGISGVNFAVAETGSIVIIENEGNARLTTSLPRVHIAVMGMEKVIPRLGDLDTFFQILPRSGTGQALTSYQSILTGPERDGSREGPRELHIIILDNGRSEMLAHPSSREALACIRCGACLNVCPVYQQIGGHAYGAVYGGPIGSVVTPYLLGLEQAQHLPFASSLCGACRDVCPVKIDIPRALVHLRGLIAGSRDKPVARSGRHLSHLSMKGWSWVMRSGRRYRVGSRLIRLLQASGLMAFVPIVRRWQSGRKGGMVAPRSFRDQWAKALRTRSDRDGSST